MELSKNELRLVREAFNLQVNEHLKYLSSLDKSNFETMKLLTSEIDDMKILSKKIDVHLSKLKGEYKMFCIEIDRSGIGEDNMVDHQKFKSSVTREEVLNYINKQDWGYDDKYCKFSYYPLS